MVCLNETISVNMKELSKLILEKVNQAIEDELYYVDDIKDDKKEIIKNRILKEIKTQVKNDNFIYRIMANNRCTYKHKHGKHDGFFCHKNITKNGDSKKYLCRTHNKFHIPKSRKNINNIEDNNKIINKFTIEKSINLIKNDIDHYPEQLQKINKTSLNIINDNSIYQKKLFKNNIKRKNIKIHIDNFNLNYFKKINKEHRNIIICKYDGHDNCYNINKYGHCDFKHTNNNISLNNFLNKDNNFHNSNISKVCVY